MRVNCNLSPINAALIFVAPCVVAQSTPAADTAAIRIAALSHWVSSLLPPPQAGLGVMCISVSDSRVIGSRPAAEHPGTDLEVQVIGVLPSSRIPLRPSSACAMKHEWLNPVIEVATGQRALWLSVGSPRIASLSQATIGLETYVHGLAGLGYLCDVERRENNWRVTACHRTWVS